MKVFKIREGGFKEIQKQILGRIIPFYVIIIIAAVLITTFGPANKNGDTSTWPIMLPVMAAFLGFSYYRSISKQRTAFESYTLTISDITIICDQEGKPSISLYHSEVQAIYRNKNGSFSILGKYPTDIIVVPAQIEEYNELEATLQNIHPITANPHKTRAARNMIVSLASITSMVAISISYNKIVVSICDIVFIAIAGWSIYSLQTNKAVDTRTKRRSLYTLLVVAAITYIAVLKVFML